MPRRPRRTDPAAAPATAPAPALEPITKAEQLLTGFTHFAGGLVKVLARLVFRPFALHRDADERGWLARLVSPHAFLAIAAFIATNAVRLLGTTLMLVLLLLSRCEAPETQLDIVFPKPDDLLKLPSVTDIVFTTIPLYVGSAILLHGLRAWVARRTSRGVDRLLALCTYVLGFQYLLWTATTALALQRDANGQYSNALFRLMFDERTWTVKWGWVAVILAPAALWPGVLIGWLLLKCVPPRTKQPLQGSVGSGFVLVAGALLFGIAAVALAAATVYPMSRMDLAAQRKARPLVSVKLAQVVEPGGALLLIVTNNHAKESLQLMRSPVEYQQAGTTKVFRRGSITRWQAGDDPILVIKGGESAWIQAEFAPQAGPATGCGAFLFGNGWDLEDWTSTRKSPYSTWWTGDLSYPYPDRSNLVGKLCLKTVPLARQSPRVFAYIAK